MECENHTIRLLVHSCLHLQQYKDKWFLHHSWTSTDTYKSPHLCIFVNHVLLSENNQKIKKITIILELYIRTSQMIIFINDQILDIVFN